MLQDSGENGSEKKVKKNRVRTTCTLLPLLVRFSRSFTLTESLAQANPEMQPSIENKATRQQYFQSLGRYCC